MKLTRRQFCWGSFASFALLGCDHQEKDVPYMAHASGHNLLLYNLVTNGIDLIPIGMNAHSLSQRSDGLRNQVFAIEKRGRIISVVDVKQKKLIKSLTLSPHELFYGHLLFTKNGDKFYSSVVNTKENTGYLVLHDTDSLKLLEKFPITSGYIHDLAFLSDKQSIAFTSTDMNKNERAELSSICLFDTKKGIVTKKSFLADEKQTTAHLCVLPDDTVVSANGVPVPNNLRSLIQITTNICSTNFSRNEKFLEIWKIPSDIQNNIKDVFLSLAITPQDGILAATNPGSSRVLYFDYMNKKLIKEEVRQTNGIGVFNKKFIFTLKCVRPGSHLLVLQA